MKRVCIFGIVLVLVSCTGTTSTKPLQRIIVDDAGDSVSIPASPERIISVSPSVTEMLSLLLSDTARLIAISKHCNFPEAWGGLPRIEPYPLNIEKILRHQSDLVLCKMDLVSLNEAEKCRTLGVPLVKLKFNSVSDIINAYVRLGDLLGMQAKGQQVADSLSKAWSAIPDTSTGLKVLVLISKDLYAFGATSYLNEIVEKAGAINAIQTAQDFPQLSREQLMRSDPDVIIVPQGMELEEILEFYPEFKKVKAFREKRLYKINGDLLSRPGPRFIETCEELRKCLSDRSYSQ